MKTKRLVVNDALITDLITQVAPLVEQETGWDLALPGLKCKVLPKDRGFEEIVIGRLHSAGIEFNPDSPRFLLDRLVELVLEDNIYAAYDTGTQTIFAIEENVDDSNLHGLKVILAHELVHRGQHLHHPELFSRVDAVIRSMYTDLMSGAIDLEQIMVKVQNMQAAMTLIESHAVYVQRQITLKYFSDARLETHFNLMSMLFQAAGGAKISQYTDGLPMVANAAMNGQIDSLYQKLSF